MKHTCFKAINLLITLLRILYCYHLLPYFISKSSKIYLFDPYVKCYKSMWFELFHYVLLLNNAIIVEGQTLSDFLSFKYVNVFEVLNIFCLDRGSMLTSEEHVSCCGWFQ